MLAIALAAGLALTQVHPNDIPLAPSGGGFTGGAAVLGAAGGVVVGDAFVFGVSYGALEAFAHGSISPTASNFRTAAIGIGVLGLVVPPVFAALGARWASGQGEFWQGALLGLLGQGVAVGTGWAAWPNAWAFVPAQLTAVSLGAALPMMGLGRHEQPGMGATPLTGTPPGNKVAARKGPAKVALGDMLLTPVCPAG